MPHPTDANTVKAANKHVPSDTTRSGINNENREFTRLSRKLWPNDREADIPDRQLKQLKLIKTHMEVMNGEVLELSQSDDDDSGGSF